MWSTLISGRPKRGGGGHGNNLDTNKCDQNMAWSPQLGYKPTHRWVRPIWHAGPSYVLHLRRVNTSSMVVLVRHINSLQTRLMSPMSRCASASLSSLAHLLILEMSRCSYCCSPPLRTIRVLSSNLIMHKCKDLGSIKFSLIKISESTRSEFS